jgi:peptide/nickel transport system permease protein
MLTKRNLTTYGIAFIIILALNFFLPRLMPGDPLMAIYGDEALVAMTPDLKAHLISVSLLTSHSGSSLVLILPDCFRVIWGGLITIMPLY